MEKTDDELVSEYLDGDEKAFEELYHRYNIQLFNFILSMVKDNEAANDIFQEVFIKVINKLPSYREGNFKAMIYLIARNSVIDFIKSKKNKNQRNNISIDQNIDEEHTLEDLIASGENPEKELITIYENKKLYEAISTLSEEYREIILLKHFSGLRFEEISKTLNIPLGTLLSRFKRAMDKLREKLI